MITFCAADGSKTSAIYEQSLARLTFAENSTATYAQLTVCPDYAFDGSEYVLLPACCYNGNRFDVLPKDYPPMYEAKEARVDMSVTMTDVIRLNQDGSGIIEATTGDVSVPTIGLFLPKHNKAVFLHTVQEIGGINLGLCYEQGKMMLRWPFFREKAAYRWPHMKESHDKGRVFAAGETVEIPYQYREYDCESMEQFYRIFFENRKIMGMDCSRPPILPFETQFEIQQTKFNYLNWYDAGGFYGPGCKTDNPSAPWQPGWCGGGMSSYALMKLGGKLEEKRAISTLRHIFRSQTPCGLLWEAADEKGNRAPMTWAGADSVHWHLIRESADVLYFIFKHFDIMKQRNMTIPAEFEAGTQKLADAFVSLWDRYGQFGQFIDLETGDIVAGGSTSGGIAPAGLCRAYEYYGNKRYLEVAEAAASQYYTRDAAKGYTTGGPGEILQCPDSEGCAGLLESLVVLYETTKEEHWLDKAKHLAHMCASWTVSYNYHFPETSEFGRLDMKTVGSVFANAQNKHSAPGICTLSGDSYYRLWKYTGDELYKELFEDTVLTVSQYMSTDKRPIYSWDVPKDASLLNDDSITAPPERLLPGYICERVNMSDWESQRCVGGVFNGSCWCESTNLLILAECAPIVDTSNVIWRED